MKYKLHITYATTEEQVRRAVDSARDIGNVHVWADGRPCPDFGSDVTRHEPGLVGCIPMINMSIKTSWDDDVMFWMHDDAWASPGVAKRLLNFVAERVEKNDQPRWGTYWTNGDKFCAFNMQCVRDVGYWDTMFFQYMGDIDYHHRMRLAGWKLLWAPNIGAVHHPESKTVKDFDPIYMHKIQFIDHTQFAHHYYERKWGGPQSQETFRVPFSDNKADARVQAIFHKAQATRNEDLQKTEAIRRARLVSRSGIGAPPQNPIQRNRFPVNRSGIKA